MDGWKLTNPRQLQDKENLMDDTRVPSSESLSQEWSGEKQLFADSNGTFIIGNNDGEAQIDPRGLAPISKRQNSRTQGTRTSLLYVLFEYCLENSLLSLKFNDQCSTIWKLDKFANASFHLHFQTSVFQWRTKIREDEVLRKRLLKQHRMELIRLCYPLPKKSGKKPIRKRGYRDKGSTRPLHQRFRTDKDTTVSVWAEDLQIVQKIVIFGRRPTVTYRRLPYSEVIGGLLASGHLKKEGDFIIPNNPKED
jgi:hypothetical protein